MSQAIDVVSTTSGSKDSVEQRPTCNFGRYRKKKNYVPRMLTQRQLMQLFQVKGVERYKEQVKVLKEGQNVDLKSKDNVSDSCKQSVEIDPLKQILSEHKAQQMEPKLYDGNIIKNTGAFVIPDSEETLMLAEESRSTMLFKKKIHELESLSTQHKIRKFFKGSIGFKSKCSMVFDQYFELNELKAQSQEKDTVIKKLKERIKSLSGNMNEDKIKKDIEEIETINIELDHRVSKLIAENEHLKQTYKQLYDTIKPTRIRLKEQCDALIAQINAKSIENSDLNAQLQEKVFAITALKEELRKLKGKSVIACRESVNKPKVIAPVVHKVDLEPLSPKLKNNREAHVDYIRITKENADTLRDVVEQARTSNPLDNALAYACMYTKQIQELLVYVSDTCPSSPLKKVGCRHTNEQS
ncbi:hypothetical protein Tco_1273007 [Tanacetum coccineum]